jgi:hypothetical protein
LPGSVEGYVGMGNTLRDSSLCSFIF